MFLKKYIYFIYITCLAALGLSCGTQYGHCSMPDLPLQRVGGLSSRGVGAQYFQLEGLVALWHVSSPPGIRPVSPTLQGGFFTSGLPGKSLNISFSKYVQAHVSLSMT